MRLLFAKINQAQVRSANAARVTGAFTTFLRRRRCSLPPPGPLQASASTCRSTGTQDLTHCDPGRVTGGGRKHLCCLRWSKAEQHRATQSFGFVLVNSVQRKCTRLRAACSVKAWGLREMLRRRLREYSSTQVCNVVDSTVGFTGNCKLATETAHDGALRTNALLVEKLQGLNGQSTCRVL